ncbi:MAG: tRNA dihydrouridine synthase DusB [Candidatus Pacearchaeota archaeon]
MKFPKLKSRVLLAPMAGVTDVAFRELCRKYGAGLTYTEFVNAIAIGRNNKKTIEMLKTSKLESPSAVQIFGSEKEDFVNAVKKLKNKFDIFDINCGCPAYKIIKNNCGSGLLKNPEKIREIIASVEKITGKPVTIKIRLGINNNSLAEKIVKIAEDAGACAVAIHGRNVEQGYGGKADWQTIKKIKENSNVIIIGNGDIVSPEIAKKRLEESKVDYIMIGRGAIGNPYIFKQINDFLKTGKYQQKSKKIQFLEYINFAKKYKVGFKQIRQQAIWFTKGIEGSARLRQRISKANTIQEVEEIIGFK